MNKTLNKYTCILAIVAVVLLSCTLVFAQTNKYRIVIDPAHGGDDSGVIGVDKIYEKDLALSIALALQKEMSKEKNFDMILTRDSDKTVSLGDRRKKISDVKPDLVLSLHVNAGFGKTSSGYELYYPGFKSIDSSKKKDQQPPASQDNKYLNDTVKLARLVQKNLDSLFPRKGRGLREADVPLGEGLTAPVLVVELGFATNPDDKKKLSSEKVQAEIAKALAKSLKTFF